jgi:PAS domain S-box-containing protein
MVVYSKDLYIIDDNCFENQVIRAMDQAKGTIVNKGPLRSTSEEEQPYRSTFDAAQVGLIITDLETGCMAEANPAACAMHGCTREDFIGQQLTAFIHPDNLKVYNEHIRAFQLDGEFDVRVHHIRRDGATLHADWRGTAFTHRGRPCLLGVVRDVSWRIQADQRLHQRIKARTREQSALLEISHIIELSKG